MKVGLKDMKKAYKNVKIDKIEVFLSWQQYIVVITKLHDSTADDWTTYMY